MPLNQGGPPDAAAWHSILRRWRVVAAFVAAGLVAAFAFAALSPHRVVAHSLVLLPPAQGPGSANATRSAGTESRIATSTPVLQKAVKSTRVPVSLDDLQPRVSASAVTSSLLDLRVEDSSAHRAIAFANAVARGYIAYSRQLAAQSGATQVRALTARAAELTTQLNALQGQIADQTAKVSLTPPGTPEAVAANAELNALQTRLTGATQDLSDVNQGLNTAKLDATGQTGGLSVLEPATSARRPSAFASAAPFLTAMVVALTVGSIAALWRERRDDRARRRIDIAAAIGAPVLASVHVPHGARAEPGDGMAEPADRADEETFRDLERRLAHGGGATEGFVVVTVPGDDDAIQAVWRLGDAAARSGLDVAFFVPPSRPVDDLHESSASAADATPRRLVLHELDRAAMDTPPDADLAIVLVLGDSSHPELPGWSESMPAVLSVSAGFARRNDLTNLAAMMRAGGRPLVGAVVTNPERRDDTNAWELPTREPELVPTRATGLPPATGVVRPFVVDDFLVWRAPDGDDWVTARAPASRPAPATDANGNGHAPSPAAPGADRFVNLHFLLDAVRRRRRWLIGSAAAGLALGIVLSIAFASPPRAETTVLLTHPGGGDPSLAMVTDAQLLTTQAVARRVVGSLSLPETPASFAASYHGTILSDSLLGISVSAPSRPEAVRRANALAHEYLAYRAVVYRRQSDAIVNELEKGQASIQRQIDAVNLQLGARAGASASTDPTTEALLSRRAGLNDDLVALNSAIVAQANVSAGVVDGSSTIDRAAPVDSSRMKELARNALSGLAAGLGIALAVVVLLAVTSRRVWRRDDVAEAMRHTVDLSTGPVPIRHWMRPHALRTLVAKPTPELERVVTHLRAQLPAPDSADRSLAVIAAGGLDVAAACVCATAAALARDGQGVVVVDASDQRIVTRGHVLGELESAPDAGDARGQVRVVSLTDHTAAPPADGRETVLVLARLDPGRGAGPVRACTSRAVALVTAGRSTMTSLRAVADMLRLAHLELGSVVFVGSSGHDESMGLTADSEADEARRGSPADAWVSAARL